jgi:hypothetical protein
MKRHLSLDVPAGFRQSSVLQQNFHASTPPKKSKNVINSLPLGSF